MNSSALPQLPTAMACSQYFWTSPPEAASAPSLEPLHLQRSQNCSQAASVRPDCYGDNCRRYGWSSRASAAHSSACLAFDGSSLRIDVEWWKVKNYSPDSAASHWYRYDNCRLQSADWHNHSFYWRTCSYMQIEASSYHKPMWSLADSSRHLSESEIWLQGT